MTPFDKAYEDVQLLVNTFDSNYKHYMSPTYSEAEARQDFIDNFFIALGWDVRHNLQTNPYAQEVKIERSQKQQNEGARKRADYAFFTAPNFKDEVFFVEAKKPSVLIAKNEQHYFQTIKYSWPKGCPVSVLTDFEEFVIVDCRQKPNIKYALNGQHKSYNYKQYADKEKFAEIYWLFSREAVGNNSLQTYANTLQKPKGKVVQKALFKGAYKSIDEDFLEYLDEIREKTARAIKKANENLNSEQLTEATQRIVDRLVFIRFLEDKFIEADEHVSEWQSWKDFITDCHKFDVKYNGVVFKRHFIDEPHFLGADEKLFVDICSDISNLNSPYDFNYIPIHILGSIYERFLGKIVRATEKRVFIEEKPEVRKAGGVYYTPKYIVDYIVKNTVGKIIEGLTPKQITEKRFADIACGSGSFLIGVYDCLLDYHKKYYTEKLSPKTESILQDVKSKNKKGAILEDDGNAELRDGQWVLTLKLKQQILLNNIYGVDIDAQAVEVTQLSLFLKMLDEESIATTTGNLFFSKVLPDLSKNIVCGNSLIGFDIMNGQLFEDDELKKLNPMDYETAFPKIMRNGGFDAVVGNPPYLSTKRGFAENFAENKYLKSKFITATKQFDSYTLFIENALDKINKNGYWGYIIPKPILSNENMEGVREMILKGGNINYIADFGTPFKDASVEAVVIIEQKKIDKNNIVSTQIFNDNNLEKENEIEQAKFLNTVNHSFLLKLNTGIEKLLTKIEFGNEKLVSLAKTFTRGIEGGKKDSSISQEKAITKKRLLRGLDVTKYEISYQNFYVNVDKKNSSKFKSKELYETEKKILIRRVGSDLQATIDTEQFWNLNTIYNLHLKDNNYELVLGIFNSKLISFWFKNKFVFEDKLFPYARVSQLEQIPIPKIDFTNPTQKQQHNKLVELVTQMLASKKQLAAANSSPKEMTSFQKMSSLPLTLITDSDKNFLQNKCNSFDRQIDNLVYTLYGLTEEEIKIVEGI